MNKIKKITAPCLGLWFMRVGNVASFFSRRRKKVLPFFSVLTITAVLVFMTSKVHSVMPPKIYADQAINSKIKAIATVKKVRITDAGIRHNTKVVTFELEYALTRGIGNIFTGSCKSVDTPKQNAGLMMGGDIYHYPQAGERYFVTISDDGGRITTMTKMTPDLEHAVRNDPGRIRYRPGKACLNPKEPTMPAPVHRGKDPDQAGPAPRIHLLDGFGTKQQLPRQSAQDIQGQFIMALGNDDIASVIGLLKQGAKINGANDQTGQTPIMWAESRPMAELLVKKGADIKSRDFYGGNVIHYAVSKKNAVALIRFFTALGVDPNQRSPEIDPAIFDACRYFYETRAFDPLFLFSGQSEKNASTGPDPRATLAALINGGADINARDDVGNTLLMAAVTWGNKDLVALLLELGADKDLDRDGLTAKDVAYDLGHRAIYQVLE